MKPLVRALLASACGGLLAGALASAALAQAEPDRRIDRLEKEIRELRAIVFQGRDTGQPVVVKPEGPDPAVEALQSRGDQLDDSLRTLRGRVEVMGHDLEEAKRQIAADHDAETELRGQVKTLTDELARFQAPPQPEASAPPGQTAPPPSGGLGTPPPTAESEAGAWRDAKSRLSGGDYGGAGDALNAYIQTYPTSPRLKEAYYLLGESYFGRNLFGDATVAYARALKDWPKTAWAADATIKLARALSSTSRPDQACSALAEFDRRYAPGATRSTKARAAAAAAAAKCST